MREAVDHLSGDGAREARLAHVEDDEVRGGAGRGRRQLAAEVVGAEVEVLEPRVRREEGGRGCRGGR